jgi:hypothetical protein
VLFPTEDCQSRICIILTPTPGTLGDESPDALAKGIWALSIEPHIVVAIFFIIHKEKYSKPKLNVLVFSFFL